MDSLVPGSVIKKPSNQEPSNNKIGKVEPYVSDHEVSTEHRFPVM